MELVLNTGPQTGRSGREHAKVVFLAFGIGLARYAARWRMGMVLEGRTARIFWQLTAAATAL